MILPQSVEDWSQEVDLISQESELLLEVGEGMSDDSLYTPCMSAFEYIPSMFVIRKKQKHEMLIISS